MAEVEEMEEGDAMAEGRRCRARSSVRRGRSLSRLDRGPMTRAGSNGPVRWRLESCLMNLSLLEISLAATLILSVVVEGNAVSHWLPASTLGAVNAASLKAGLG